MMTMNSKNEENTGESPIRHEDFKEEAGSSELLNEILKLYPGKQNLVKMLFGMTSAASKIVSKTGDIPSKLGKALFTAPEREKIIQEAGASLRDLREVAGLTLRELSDAARLPDQSLLTAVENGTATLSFELILRLAALLARHDPVPFIIKYTRTYNPEIWAIMKDWGLGKLPLQLERERQFINIYRSNDAARELSDKEFGRILEFTRSAFEMALQFVMEEGEK